MCVCAATTAACVRACVRAYGRHFVPNLTLGAPIVKALRKHTRAFLDCHLMVRVINHPGAASAVYVLPYASAVHPTVCRDACCWGDSLVSACWRVSGV